MSRYVKIVPNIKGITALRKSREVQADLERRAKAIAAAAGAGMEVDVRVGATRARASVVTATEDAKRREAEGRALTRAIDAGRA